MVKMMADGLSALVAELRVDVDLPDETGYHRPLKISGFIPDVYAWDRTNHKKYICEAKTWSDLETERSFGQMAAFIECVNKEPKGLFILGVYGNAVACRAKTVLRSLLKEKEFSKETVQVFDGLDYWRPEETRDGAITWHLC